MYKLLDMEAQSINFDKKYIFLYNTNELRKEMNMKIKRFNVVELNNNNRATILEIRSNNQYFAEIVNPYGITVENRIITNDEISKVIYSRAIER